MFRISLTSKEDFVPPVDAHPPPVNFTVKDILPYLTAGGVLRWKKEYTKAILNLEGVYGLSFGSNQKLVFFGRDDDGKLKGKILSTILPVLVTEELYDSIETVKPSFMPMEVAKLMALKKWIGEQGEITSGYPLCGQAEGKHYRIWIAQREPQVLYNWLWSYFNCFELVNGGIVLHEDVGEEDPNTIKRN